jgi:hypothetical protein
MFYFFFHKTVLLKVINPVKIYQHTKFHDPTLTGASFVSTSEVWTPTILKWLKLHDKKWRRCHLHDFPTKLNKNPLIGSNVIRDKTMS